MGKFFSLVVASSLAAMGCDNKDVAATDKPATVAVETPKAEKPAIAAEPVKEAAADGKWVTIKGRVVWDDANGAVPQRKPIQATKDQEVCAKDKEFLTEDWVVNPKNKGIQHVVVWLAPEPPAGGGKLKDLPPFDKNDINPAVLKAMKPSVEIDQPCCRFIPHVVVAQEGQKMVIKNSAPVPHNAKWASRSNGEINPLIPGGGQFNVQDPLVAERFPITVECSIHPWMKAYVWVFKHPYFAVTDADGNFEIKDAPVLNGKLRLVMWHEGGVAGDWRLGESVEVKPGTTDLKEVKLKNKK